MPIEFLASTFFSRGVSDADGRITGLVEFIAPVSFCEFKVKRAEGRINAGPTGVSACNPKECFKGEPDLT